MTTAVLPRPMAVDGVVFIDVPGRTLHVRLPDAADTHTRSLWRTAHQALVTAEQLGYRSTTPDVWAYTDRRRDVAFARPGELLTLQFVFERTPDSAFAELVGKPRLVAIVVIDRSAGHFMSVRFLHRPG